MHFTVFNTKLGHSGVVYWTRDEESKAVHILLPTSKDALMEKIVFRYPTASETRGTEVAELVRSIQDFFLGAPEQIPMRLVDTTVCTPFQLSVLLQERTIPRGKTSSYGRLAKKLNSNAVRAVGSALAKNPFPIVVPCHRAVRSDRTLGGFQGGLNMKRRILTLEGIRFDGSSRVHPDSFIG
ncbi:MAG: methylated-DNA--[protein]-cysteine S-methyltransferase [Candidatus Thorarchaeota archaeon]